MKIVFIDCTRKPYDGDSSRKQPLGGIQSVTVNISESLVKRGHNVRVLNQVSEAKQYNGVDWLPFDTPIDDADIVVVNNNPDLFDKAAGVLKRGGRCYIWLHNSVELFKVIRRKRYLPLLKYRPKAIFLSQSQKRGASFLLPFRSSIVMPHAIDDQFFAFSKAALNAERPKRAIYFSQPYRGLYEMCALWCKHVHPKTPDAEYHVFGGREYMVERGADISLLEGSGILFRERVQKAALIDELLQARVLLYPGHKDETFCNAAAESSACGVAIVTQGIGSLKERVVDGKSGFMRRDDKDMAECAVRLFTDDAVFSEMSEYSMNMVQDMRWDGKAKEWENHAFCD